VAVHENGNGDEPAKVTLAHLRRAEEVCGFRLAREHADSRGNWGSSVRWQVSNRVLDDIRLAHTELAAPRPDRFLVRTDLTPEQEQVYDLATRWYVTLFGDRAVRAVDEDPWSTERADGIRLVGRAGLGLVDAEGGGEIRLLQIGGRPEPATALLDSPTVRFALLRRPEWLDGRRVRISAADLVRGTYADETVDTTGALAVVEDWLAERMTVVRERVAAAKPRFGLECGWCAFIAACPALRGRA
jgi:hypothetical protein